MLLTDKQISAGLTTMRMHLKPNGIAVFESRNPGIDWAIEWNSDRVLQLETGEVNVTSRLIEVENEFITFQLRYLFPDETLSSVSRLRFMSRADIQEHLIASGLQVDRVFGDWDSPNPSMHALLAR